MTSEPTLDARIEALITNQPRFLFARKYCVGESFLRCTDQYDMPAMKQKQRPKKTNQSCRENPWKTPFNGGMVCATGKGGTPGDEVGVYPTDEFKDAARSMRSALLRSRTVAEPLQQLIHARGLNRIGREVQIGRFRPYY